ncbi:MAG: tetratricopeptide repeat protein [Terriglobia bacterium]|jgi:tetratricopeptide (TPR) repeat protein
MAFNKAKALQEADKLASQRKLADAIKHYLLILEKDPSEISILNTVGDLYIRDNKQGEALKYFSRLAEAYTKDGFTLKAIAMYKKITKLDPGTIDPILKLGELYTLQGLNREAREQYSQAVEYFKKKNLPDRALETYRKIVSLDPENRTFRARLADMAEQLGRKDEAAKAYLELSETALRAGDAPASEAALKKSLQLSPQSAQAQLLQARLAASKKDYARVEQILGSDARLKGSEAGRHLLLDTYLATQRLDAAKKLVVEAFQSNPKDFSPLVTYSRLCLEGGNVDSAIGALKEVLGLITDRAQAAPMMDVLRHIWSAHPDHLATMELILAVTEQTHDEAALPEVLGALGHAYAEGGDLEKAETVYQRLAKNEPANEEYGALLKGVQRRMGKGEEVLASPALESLELAVPVAEALPAVDEKQVAMVKEALENGDLYSRYGLIDKALAELEKVLASYPEQVDIHRRIFEICQRTQPARARQAAETLAQIYSKQGDLKSAGAYEGLAQGKPGAAVAEVVPAALEPPAAPPSEPAPVEIDFSEVFATPIEEAPTTEVAPQEVPVPMAPPPETPAVSPAAQEIDLSSDFGALAAEPPAVEAVPEAVPGFTFDESRVEVEFYLSQGFADEARRTVEGLEGRFPGDPQVASLRKLLEGRAAAPTPVAGAEAPPAEFEFPAEAVAAAPEAPSQPAETALPSVVPEAWTAAPPPQMPPPPAVEPPPAAGADLLGDLAGDLADGLAGLGNMGPPPPTPKETKPSAAPDGVEASPLSGWLDELGEAGPEVSVQDDPETHYNLGVAFREMGLLDEAIGEFQKVVKGVQKGSYPPNFLQACSLLAVSFMDKGMPQIAARWYTRALETPDLNEESTLALEYDLGVAYEQAGETHNALARFSEVYSQNIDYRDVAEKIRTLQQKTH